ncbi:SDR family NAD(P)-dependent oxidoreductase [Xanthomonas citri]|uniref:SDR family NAD(P)-dependent oxidoreductase n=1 Tax=Xanthomonas citri TaxID=346 RepID=UPI0018859623|nr:SDR family NAD(P)-dependent oxidoreductase [Xanthomonas citri]QOY21865.1 SDR family NAD(P)-dependent oxidoreductase [Xanthomonas citri]QQK68007.1 SDR family NAD(P)-dependent oxidoreductase [Xanthomonas citri]
MPSRKPHSGRKSRIFISGSTDGLGLATARTLLSEGHDVVVHVRSVARLSAVEELVHRGAKTTVGDLSNPNEVRELALQINAIGSMDAVIHNAGVVTGPHVLAVNVVAPYLLTCLIKRPRRLIYLSSAMHRGGRAELAGMAWTGTAFTCSYSDSKLYVTTLAAAVARRWPKVMSNAVDPGWVPTRMGGPDAPDNLVLGHHSQEWLATSNAPEALISGGYWHHQALEQPHPAVNDSQFQDKLLIALAQATGVGLT